MEKDYKMKGIHDLSLPKRITKFISDNSEVEHVGQGNITTGCSKFWDMSCEEFEQTFGVKISEKDL